MEEKGPGMKSQAGVKMFTVQVPARLRNTDDEESAGFPSEAADEEGGNEGGEESPKRRKRPWRLGMGRVKGLWEVRRSATKPASGTPALPETFAVRTPPRDFSPPPAGKHVGWEP
jgi:hypothetical protein